MLMTSAPDDDGRRGSGRTTRQMLAAPIGSLFIWCNGRLDYPRNLARHLGRDDLQIVSPSVFDYGARPYGWLPPPAVILDHAAPDHMERGALAGEHGTPRRLVTLYELAEHWYGRPIPAVPEQRPKRGDTPHAD